MLRLVLDSAFRGSAKLPSPILDGACWYSEARLAPPFMWRSGSASCHLAEGFTHLGPRSTHCVMFSCDAWCGVSHGLACPDPSSD